MTQEQLLAKIAMLEAQVAQATAAKPNNTIKVSAKGAVSVYGLGRFPITLYSSQWDKLISKVDEIKTFIDANKDKLAIKES